jgi:HEAT repeat protein
VLIAALEDYSETVRRISALALLDVATIRGLSAVVAGSRHGHAVRTEAAHRLGKRGAEAAAAIPGLLALLHYGDINWRSHMAAAYALAAIGAPALPYLFHALTCGDGYPSLYAAIALDSIGPPPEYQQLVQEMLAPLSESKGAAASAVAAPDSVRDSNSKDI